MVAATGSSCGITWLMGGTYEQVAYAVPVSYTHLLQVQRLPYKLPISSVSLVRFAEKVPLSRGKRLTVVPNGNPDVRSATGLNKG